MDTNQYIRSKLGEEIRHRRLEKNWSQEELGFAANTHRTYIGALERGEKAVTVEKLSVLATALDCKASDLLRGIGM